MAKLSTQEYVEKWQRRTTGAAPDVQRGIQRVDASPTEAAASKKDKMLANVTMAVQNGKWEAGLRRVSLGDWKKAAIEKGIPRISQGVNGATAKMADFASQLLPYQDSLKQQIAGMPDLTIEDNINRMVTFVRGMTKFKRT